MKIISIKYICILKLIDLNHSRYNIILIYYVKYFNGFFVYVNFKFCDTVKDDNLQ